MPVGYHHLTEANTWPSGTSAKVPGFAKSSTLKNPKFIGNYMNIMEYIS